MTQCVNGGAGFAVSGWRVFVMRLVRDGRRSSRRCSRRRSKRSRVSCRPAGGMPLSRWSSWELACEAIAAGVVTDISPATVRRLLAGDALKPWRYQSWIAPRAPDFAAKAAVVLDLYARTFDGK